MNEVTVNAHAIFEGMIMPWRWSHDIEVLNRSDSVAPLLVGALVWTAWLALCLFFLRSTAEYIAARRSSSRRVRDLMAQTVAITDLDDPQRLAACAELDTLVDSRFVALVSHSNVRSFDNSQWWVFCPSCQCTSRGFYDGRLAFDEGHRDDCTFDGRLRRPDSDGYGTTTTDEMPYPVTSPCRLCGEPTDHAESRHPNCLTEAVTSARHALTQWSIEASSDDLARCLLAMLDGDAKNKDLATLYRYIADPSPKHTANLHDLSRKSSDASDVATALLEDEPMRHHLLTATLYHQTPQADPMTTIHLAERFASMPTPFRKDTSV